MSFPVCRRRQVAADRLFYLIKKFNVIFRGCTAKKFKNNDKYILTPKFECIILINNIKLIRIDFASRW